MAALPMAFTSRMMELASTAIVEICSFKLWFLFTHNVRTTHFHMIVNCGCPADPDRVLGQVKACVTRALRNAGLISMDAKVWTAKGRTRWINHEPGLRGAIAYFNDWQKGPHRELLEAHTQEYQRCVRLHREWLRSIGLPEDGRGVVLEPVFPPSSAPAPPATVESSRRYEPGA